MSIEEHFEIHMRQGDLSACLRLGKILNKSFSELSKISSDNQKSRVRAGTHPFVNSEIQREHGKRSFLSQQKNGTHLFLNTGYQKAHAVARVKNGTHPFLRRPDGSSISSDNIKNGTGSFSKSKNPNYLKICCLTCKKEVNLPIFYRNHLSTCRGKNPKYYDPENKMCCLTCKKTVVLPVFKRRHANDLCKNPTNDK